MGHRVTTLNVNTIEPAGATLTIGADGDSVVLADDVKSNTYKDAGGNTLFTSNGSGVLSSVNSGFGDALKLLSTQTASNSASLSFTSGITSTYKEYIFRWHSINPATDDAYFHFQINRTDMTNYDDTHITSSYWDLYHNEADNGAAAEYRTGYDLHQGPTFQTLMPYMGSGSDESGVGELHLFNPASTTYVKHFYVRTNWYYSASAIYSSFVAGYFNTTVGIDDVQFKMSTGNFDGTITMSGVI